MSQLSDNLIDTASEQDIKDKVSKTVEIQKIENQIEKLTKKMVIEKQFNRQCEIRTQIKNLQKQLQSLKGTNNG